MPASSKTQASIFASYDHVTVSIIRTLAVSSNSLDTFGYWGATQNVI